MQLPWNPFAGEDPVFDIDGLTAEADQFAKMRALWDANALHNPLVACDFFCGGFVEQYERNGARIAEFVAEKLERQPGGRLLDLGSGAGRLARYLAGDAAHYALADVSPHLLDAARTRLGSGGPFTYTALAGATLPFADGSFDACLAVDVVVHLPEAILRGWFAEVARVLVPGGRFLLTAGVPPAVGSIDFGPSRQLLRLLNLRPLPFGARTGAVLARMLADGPLHPIGRGEDFPNLLPVLGVQAPFAGYWLLFERP